MHFIFLNELANQKHFEILLSCLMNCKKEFEEFVNRRRTDNTIAQKKMDKRTKNDLQNIHIQLKIEQHEPL